MKSRRAAVLVLSAMLASAIAVPGASAQPDPVYSVVDLVNELTLCSMWVDEPHQSGDSVVGYGGGRGCGPNQTVAVVVCLVYNGVTMGSSCTPRTGRGSASGGARFSPCLPGLWQTQVTANTPGPNMEVVSDPVLILCVPR